MQNRAIKLMASKLAAAGIIEGSFTDEGLAAMSDCADMTTALARELTQGIKNEVEDLSAVFKKMAILKPVVEQIPFETVNDNITFTEIADIVKDTAIINAIPVYQTHIIDDTSEVTIYSTNAPLPTSGLLSFVNYAKPTKAISNKDVDEIEDFLYSIFEKLAVA